MRTFDPRITTCPSCGLRLRSAVLRDGAALFVIYFYGDEWVKRCPRCHEELDGNAVDPRQAPPLPGTDEP